MLYEFIPQLLIILSLVGIIVILGRKMPVVRDLLIAESKAALKPRHAPKKARGKRYYLHLIQKGLGKTGHTFLAGLKGLGRCLGRGVNLLSQVISHKIAERREKKKADLQRAEEKGIELKSKDIAPQTEVQAVFERSKREPLVLEVVKRRPKAKAKTKASRQDKEQELSIDHLLTQAKRFVKLGRFHKAETACLTIIRRNPHNARVYKVLGDLYFQQGNFPDAEKSLKEALKRGVDEIDVYKKLGLAFTEEGKTKEALKVYQQAIRNNRGKEYFYLELGKFYRSQGEIDKAVKIYEELNREYPGNYKYIELLEKQKKLKD